MKSEKFYSLQEDINKSSVKSMLSEFLIEEGKEGNAENIPDNGQVDARANDLVLDAVIEISQTTKDKGKKSFQFIVCDVWLKPNNVFTVVNKTKEKTEANAWILFYDNSTWYVRKQLQAAATVRVKLISLPDQK